MRAASACIMGIRGIMDMIYVFCESRVWLDMLMSNLGNLERML